MSVVLDELPNPHLAGFLPPDFQLSDVGRQILAADRYAAGWRFPKLSVFEQEEVQPLRDAHLKACGLPPDYDELSAKARRQARMRTLHGWYNPQEAHVLVGDVNKLVSAVYLWVEEYLKPAERNQGIYYHRDPYHKYEMVRAAFGPPKVATEPTKTLITAPRGSTKSRTFIGQVVPMMVCCRPNTEVLITEINEDRTIEEMSKIQMEFEENELIHADFGGKGSLFPKSGKSGGAYKWAASRLDFIHHPGCSILGYSWASAQRGRHPKLWIIDDPEDPAKPMTVEERRKFWIMLFRRGMGMFQRGNAILWISTLILGGCCDKAMSRIAVTDPELQTEIVDIRFDDWYLLNFDLLRENKDTGKIESIFPDHISAQGYEEKEKAIGKRDAMAEYRGIATAAGECVLHRERDDHHYMHCARDLPGGGREEYMYDLVTGESIPWAKFLRGLYIGQATDIASSTDRDADYGCTVAVGVNNSKFPVFYVLDCYMDHVLSEKLVFEAFVMAGLWKSEVAGFENVAMQNVVVRYAKQFAAKLEAKGVIVPRLVPINNYQQQKVPRILATLRILYSNRRIRFPWLSPVIGQDGTRHVPVRHASTKYLNLLYSQLDLFTDQGASGNDDGPDALQMALRLLQNNRGFEVVDEDANGQEIRAWQEGGIEFSPGQIDIKSWTPDIWERMGIRRPELRDMEVYD